MRLHALLALAAAVQGLFAASAHAVSALAQAAPQQIPRIEPERWLVLDALPAEGTPLLPADPVFREHLLAPDAPPPEAGQRVGDAEWRAALSPLPAAARAWTSVEVENGGAWLARLTGAERLWINGARHPAVPEGVPVALRAGRNEICVEAPVRGARLVLQPPPAPVCFATWDAVREHLVDGAPTWDWGLALPVLNVGAEHVDEVSLGHGPLLPAGTRPLDPTEAITDYARGLHLPPLAVRCLAFPLALAGAPTGDARIALLAWSGRAGEARHRIELPLPSRPLDAPRRATFLSSIDASIQPFALRPPSEPPTGPARIVLALHDAGADELDLVQELGPLPDAWLVAPRGRRAHAFGWRRWGLVDAAEVLSAVREEGSSLWITGRGAGDAGARRLAAELGLPYLAPDVDLADPQRAGAIPDPAPTGPDAFLRGFDNDFQLVYGTRGDDARDAELYARALADLQSFWARAGGAPELLDDRTFLNASNAPGERSRNVVLYGNLETNAAYGWVVGTGRPLRFREGFAELAGRRLEGADRTGWLLVPRADADEGGLVLVLGDTGPTGTRLGLALRPFAGDAAPPEWGLFSPSSLETGEPELSGPLTDLARGGER